MTGKVLDKGVSSALVLIFPLALIVVLILKAWLYLLLFLILVSGWNLWQSYRWKQQCLQVDPYFHALIREHQGYLTPMDLSFKANLSATSAAKFLAKKAEEYGAQRKNLGDKGSGYYFLTASALQSIFEASEPPLEEDDTLELSLEPEASRSEVFSFLTSKSEDTPSTPEIEATNPTESVIEETLTTEEITPTESVIEETLTTEEITPTESVIEETNPIESVIESVIEETLTTEEITPTESVIEETLTTEETNPTESVIEETLTTEEITPTESVIEETNPIESVIEETVTETETDLSESVVDNSTQEIEHQTDSTTVVPLTQVELAKRLNTNSSAIRKKRLAPDFSSWSQSRDPDGIAWKYSPKDNSPKNIMFEPIDVEE